MTRTTSAVEGNENDCSAEAELGGAGVADLTGPGVRCVGRIAVDSLGLTRLRIGRTRDELHEPIREIAAVTLPV